MRQLACIHVLAFAIILLLTLRLAADESAKEAKLGAQDVEFFEKEIRPLLASRCYSCHSEAKDKREGGLTLDLRSGWRKGGDSGTAIVPGDVENSLLIQAVRYRDDSIQMPPDKALPDSAVKHLEQWVARGAPDPRDGVARPPSEIPSDPITGRSHWAFQPLRRQAPPRSDLEAWPASPIDEFVFAKLQQARLSPVDDASPRKLVRRLSYLLTGLPPSADVVDEFLSDSCPDAYERLVDRLLSQPQFGERWGRHWLDLARFADSNGLDENFLFREAWRYRNWTIDSVNRDLSYDRFLAEQIAGDLLPFDSIAQRDRQRIAAGFLVIGPKVLLGNNPNERIMDVADEQLDTIGKAVLGMTLGCARCHDHKFDPIPTADYYALAGIFTSTKVMERRFMLGQQRTMERLIGLGVEGHLADEAYEKYWRERAKLDERLKQGKAALDLLKKGDLKGATELAKKQPATVAEVALDRTLTQKERIAAQQSQLKLLELAAKPRSIPPRAMIPEEAGKPIDEPIRVAGQYDQKGEVSPRGFLKVLCDSEFELPDDQSGRLELARWLTDCETGAGRLTARVMANRVWRHMLGRGIVRTVDNFGRTGEEPSHPGLLDYLAAELIDANWSIKSLIRKIALSRTFRLGSQHQAEANEVDPTNGLLWRSNRRRLDPESLRDGMLSIAGQLDRKRMDSTVYYLGDQATAVGANKNRRRTDFPCRSVYLPVIRNDLPELFDVFDFADPHATTGDRSETMVATQGLFLLNADLVMKSAEATARRIITSDPNASPDDRLDRMTRLVFGERLQGDEERAGLLRFVRDTAQELKSEGEKDPLARAWALACHALIASSRFQVLE